MERCFSEIEGRTIIRAYKGFEGENICLSPHVISYNFGS